MPVLEPVLNYQIILPEGCDVHQMLKKLRELEEEDPQLHIVWDEQLGRNPRHAHGRRADRDLEKADLGAVPCGCGFWNGKYCI